MLFQDPCRLATLTIDPTILTSNPYSYTVDAPADIQTLLDSKVTSSETTAPCPPDFIFSVTKRDGTPFDSTLFTWTPATQEFKTETNLFSHYQNSPYDLTLHVAYEGYPIADSLDFRVIVDISCTSATFDDVTLSDMTFSVLGTPDT